jgi:hypothetical protein
MHVVSKMFTTEIGLVSLCRLSQRMLMGIPSTMSLNTQWLSLKEMNFLWRSFLAKGLSGRKIELDEVIEPEQDDQSSSTPKNVLEAATAFIDHASTMCCSYGIEVPI